MIKKTILKILGILINVLLIASIGLLIFSGYIAYQNRNNPENAFILGYKPIYTVSGSMEPTIRTHGIALVKQCQFSDIKPNDIILFNEDGKTIVHRVVSKTSTEIRTKGDNNNVADAFTLTPASIKGKVIEIWNWTAIMYDKLHEPYGIVKYLIIPGGLIVIAIACTTLLVRDDSQKNKI